LSRNLKREDLVELLEESLAYRLGRIGYSEFYDGLKERCGKTGMVLTPEMERYIGYITLVEGIDRENLFKELKSLEDEAWRMRGIPISSFPRKRESSRGISSLDSRFRGNDEEGNGNDEMNIPLIQMDRDYKLLVKALDFKLSPDEWEEYGGREKAIGEMVKGSVAESLLKNVSRFNQLSHQRNRIFVEKLYKRMEEKKTNVSVLIAGGYHSQGVEEKLKQKGISYITIRPRMEMSEIKDGYHPLAVFKRTKIPLEELFLPEKVSLAQSGLLGSGFGRGNLVKVAEGMRKAFAPAVGECRHNKGPGKWVDRDLYYKEEETQMGHLGVAVSKAPTDSVKGALKRAGVKVPSGAQIIALWDEKTQKYKESVVVWKDRALIKILAALPFRTAKFAAPLLKHLGVEFVQTVAACVLPDGQGSVSDVTFSSMEPSHLPTHSLPKYSSRSLGLAIENAFFDE
ncbi:MAG: hypothetical protein HYY63_00085, partial [Elusimicrobia bacterium]|nr:hypothetical protein [Elusimicrobiota bacterium]